MQLCRSGAACTRVGAVGFEEVGDVVQGGSSPFVVGELSLDHGKLSSHVVGLQAWLAKYVMVFWMVVSIFHLTVLGSGAMF